MKITRNKKKLSFSEYMLKIVAYTLTIVWIGLLFLPIYWMMISSLKDSSEMYRDPPSFLPTIPNKYSVVLEYDLGKWNEISLEGFERDANIILWQTLQLKNSNVGKAAVYAKVSGSVVASATLSKSSYVINRPKVWTKSILRTEDIVKTMKKLTKADYVQIDTTNINLPKQVKVNTATDEIKTFVTKDSNISGKLSNVTYTKSLANMFDSYIIAWNYPQNLGLANGLRQAIFNTLYLAFMGIFLQSFAAALAAYSLSKFMPKKTKGILMMAILAIGMVPATVTIVPTYQILEMMGLTNSFWGVLLPGICNFMAVLLLKGTFDNLTDSILEAARIDGAGETRIFLKFAIPSAKGVFGVLALFGFTGTWNNFFWPMIILRDQSKYTVAMVVNVLINGTGSAPDYSMILAFGFLISIPTLVVFGLFQKSLSYGFDYSGLKG